MKQLNFSVNSWHYWFATRVSYDPRCDNENICTYLRHVLGGMLLVTVLTIIGTIVAYGLIAMLLGIGFSLLYGAWIFSEIGVTTFILTTIMSVWAVTYFLFTGIGEYRHNRNEAYRDAIRNGTIPRPIDGFVKNAYKSWKQKYCVKINFIDKSTETKWDGT